MPSKFFSRFKSCIWVSPLAEEEQYTEWEQTPPSLASTSFNTSLNQDLKNFKPTVWVLAPILNEMKIYRIWIDSHVYQQILNPFHGTKKCCGAYSQTPSWIIFWPKITRISVQAGLKIGPAGGPESCLRMLHWGHISKNIFQTDKNNKFYLLDHPTPKYDIGSE